MPFDQTTISYDVAIIGGGPAGLSAAIVLGRACRRVILFDHGQPRNFAARAVHGYLGLDGIAPFELRDRGLSEAKSYAVELVDSEVISVSQLSAEDESVSRFAVSTKSRVVKARAILFATGVLDELPEIRGVRDLYGLAVYHCPYCDGWEHRGKSLAAMGNGPRTIELAILLKGWSSKVTCCSNRYEPTSHERQLLTENAIPCRRERISSLAQHDGAPVEISFEEGEPLVCDAVFFSADQHQHSKLPKTLGCELDEDGLVRRDHKHQTCIEGVFVAGDAGGEVQLAMVAAGQGATAATAINKMLQQQNTTRKDFETARTHR